MAEAVSQEFTYLYRAMRPSGSRALGVRTAPDESALAEALRGDELLLMRSWKLPIGSASIGRLPLRDEAALNEQIEALLSRGVPLVEALEVAATVVSGRTKPRVLKLRDLVASGATFSGACETVGGFDDVTIAVYRAAERTGDLAGAARRLAQAARRRLGISGKALTVMIYPSIVLVIALGLFSVLMVVVVPMMAEQIERLNPDGLPWYSEAVFAIGTWLKANLTIALILILVALAGALVAWRRVFEAFGAVGRRLPGIKTLLLSVELTRFFSVMAAMSKSGVPLADALGTSARVISHAQLRSQLEWLRQSLVDGGVLRQLLEKVTTLPLATRRLLIAAERGGDLDSAFDGLAADMAEDVEKRSSRLLALLEPAVIVLMFSIIAPLIIAIAVPMMTRPTDF